MAKSNKISYENAKVEILDGKIEMGDEDVRARENGP